VFLHDLTRQTAIESIAADAHISGVLAEKLSKTVPVIQVWNKADLVPECKVTDGLTLSTKTGLGLDSLRRTLLESAGWSAPIGGVFVARERHIQALDRVACHLDEAAQHLSQQAQSLDLLAEELRMAQNALNDITGQFSSDDLLGVIFSKFCIGK
jgi:tRNA modification GTPase